MQGEGEVGEDQAGRGVEWQVQRGWEVEPGLGGALELRPGYGV